MKSEYNGITSKSFYVGPAYVAASLDRPGDVFLDAEDTYLTADEAVELAESLLAAARNAKKNAEVILDILDANH